MPSDVPTMPIPKSETSDNVRLANKLLEASRAARQGEDIHRLLTELLGERLAS